MNRDMFKVIFVAYLALALISGCSSPNPSNVPNSGVDVSYQKKETLPKVEKPYPPDEAIRNGDIVNLHGQYSNLHLWQGFLKNMENKQTDQIRITQYSIEGAPIFYELLYSGTDIAFTYDNSMDGFAGNGKGRQSTVCSGIKKKKFESSGEMFILTGCASQDIGDFFHF